jgi:hypothetical protein
VPVEGWFVAAVALKRAAGGPLGAFRGRRGGTVRVSKTGVVKATPTTGGGHVHAGLDTRRSEDYASGDEVLPDGEPAVGLGHGPGVPPTDPDAFAGSRELFEGLCGWLGGSEAVALTHGELEQRLTDESRELFCRIFQDHLELRSQREQRIESVLDSEGVRHANLESGHVRSLQSVFGELRVSRIAYRARGQRNLCPVDADLNLPAERHSHGLRRWAAVECARGSYEDACEAIEPGQKGRETLARAPQHRVSATLGWRYAGATRSSRRCCSVLPGLLKMRASPGWANTLRLDLSRVRGRHAGRAHPIAH